MRSVTGESEGSANLAMVKLELRSMTSELREGLLLKISCGIQISLISSIPIDRQLMKQLVVAGFAMFVLMASGKLHLRQFGGIID